MEKTSIKYLIKFVAKRSYAKDLLQGKLFMHPATYYHNLAETAGAGQGDLGEASIVPGLCIYKYYHLPIYCMYAVLDSDIKNGETLIDGRCISDFHCSDGFAVLIDFSQFEPMLYNVKTEGYELEAGLVTYHALTQADLGPLMIDDTPRNLFIKRPGFLYQKEFRIVICKQIYRDGEPPVYEKVYWLDHALDAIAKIIPISSLRKRDNNYVLPL